MKTTNTETLSAAESFYFPVGRRAGTCERCGRGCNENHGMVWSNGDVLVFVGEDCAHKMGFWSDWYKALRSDAIDTAIGMAIESGFVGSFCCSVRDRLLSGRNLSERQAEIFGGICSKRFLPRLADTLRARYGVSV